MASPIPKEKALDHESVKGLFTFLKFMLEYV